MAFNCLKTVTDNKQKDYRKSKIAVCLLIILFIIYMAFKCTVGVPIINIYGATKKISDATFVYIDKTKSEYTCYYYALFKNRELYTFCGNVNYLADSDVLSENYFSRILKARSRYISKKEYEAILKWGYEADFYSESEAPPRGGEMGRIYYYANGVRPLSEASMNMIESSDYIFNNIFDNEKFYDEDLLYYQNPEDRFTWWYDGKRYVPRIIIGYNGDLMPMR